MERGLAEDRKGVEGCVDTQASVVVDGHVAGGGEGLEGGAAIEGAIEGVVGNGFDITRHRNTVQQRAVAERLNADRCEG